MDRNQAIGLTLMSLLIFGYLIFFSETPQKKQPVSEKTEQKSNQTSPGRQESGDQQPVEERQSSQNDQQEDAVRSGNGGRDSAALARKQSRLGIFKAGASGTSKIITLENKDVEYQISTRGAGLKRVTLKNYQTYDKRPLVLLDSADCDMNLKVNAGQVSIDLADVVYQTSARSNIKVSGRDSTSITFTVPLTDGGKLTRIYKLAPEGFTLQHNISITGSEAANIEDKLAFSWKNKTRLLEKELQASRRRSTINYYTTTGDFEDLASVFGDTEQESADKPLKWVSMKQRFFSSSIIASDQLNNTRLLAKNGEDSSVVKSYGIEADIPLKPQSDGLAQSYTFYFGPNKLQVMQNVTAGFDENVDLGFFGINFINKYLVSYTFHFLENYIANYGIIILILVILVKIILFPLSYKSYISMAKMKVLKPEIDEIKEKHGNDMQKAQQEQMQLYQKVGVNPMSGCVPMLLQLPILLSLFHFFPNSIELRQEPFLWAEDLSTYDSVLSLPFTIPWYGNHVSLFTLLMTLSTILYTWSNNQTSSVQGPMKNVQYIMPFIIMFALNSFAAALTYYYFISNIITFGQQMVIRRFVDDETIMAKLEENRRKNKDKKKSKFQERLEEAMKASEEAKKQKSGNQKGGNQNQKKPQTKKK